ncbi:ADP-dependent glucokinase-like [Anneissia japonica]|uniref:ADP-dependent glucokinase-like n=1 Tax=Anneissia japonica TaxID=1529436 RepID=UPI00142557D0|nr:ADP-dependent glucokinase-like [Anneissia japonica]
MASKTYTIGSILSILAIIVAYFYKCNLDEQLKEHLDNVLKSLLKVEKKFQITPKTKVALGLGSCTDAFQDGIELLKRSGIEPPTETNHHSYISSKEGLAQTFAYFFQYGAAAERYVSDKELFKTLVQNSKGANTRWAMGGNAPAMARRMALEGCDVLLGSRLSTKQMRDLGGDIQSVGKPLEDEDVHIILEYDKGAKWGPYTSPRANRLIIHSDESNPTLEALEDFAAELKAFNPAALVMGGLQMMDNYPFKQGEREERMMTLQRMLADTPMTIRSHFEMASFTDEHLIEDVLKHVIPFIDSIGTNEQELTNLYSILNYGNVTLVTQSYPRVASVLDQMRSIYNILSKTKESDGQRKLTRLHVHTLAFQAILTTHKSAWKNTMAAAAKSSLTAYRYVCGTKEIDIAKSRILMDEGFSVSMEKNSRKVMFEANRPVSCWDESDYQICIAPVLVCTEVRQTAGGGDNVSAAGLTMQI